MEVLTNNRVFPLSDWADRYSVSDLFMDVLLLILFMSLSVISAHRDDVTSQEPGCASHFSDYLASPHLPRCPRFLCFPSHHPSTDHIPEWPTRPWRPWGWRWGWSSYSESHRENYSSGKKSDLPLWLLLGGSGVVPQTCSWDWVSLSWDQRIRCGS